MGNKGMYAVVLGFYPNDKAQPIRYQRVPLDDRYADAPEMMKLLASYQRELETVMRGPINPENEQKKKEIAELIEKLLEQEEIRWNQRSRANWLQNGDRNTSYFHSFATARKKRNCIKKNKEHKC
jgi:hypothetical protein